MIDPTLFAATLRAPALDQPEKPDKGHFNGSCNRRACQAPGATFWNPSTRAHYCRSCAGKINHANPEFPEWRLKDVALRDASGRVVGRKDDADVGG